MFARAEADAMMTTNVDGVERGKFNKFSVLMPIK